jgi:hypothetical protein
VAGRENGLIFGTNATGISFSAFYDPLCDGCAEMHPIFEEFLDKEWLGGKKVRDLVLVSYSFFPLPYHHGSWVVSKLLPYFQDLCRTDSSSCQLYIDYANYCLTNRDWILDDVNRSYNDLI